MPSRSGKGLGPRVLLAGLVDGDAPGAFGAVVAATPEQGRAVVDRYKAAGFNQMKLYSACCSRTSCPRSRRARTSSA